LNVENRTEHSKDSLLNFGGLAATQRSESKME